MPHTQVQPQCEPTEASGLLKESEHERATHVGMRVSVYGCTALLLIATVGAIILRPPSNRSDNLSSTNTHTHTYTYTCTGACAKDATTYTTSGLALMGGGSDVDAAFLWMSDRAGGGDFLVLSASGVGDYNGYIYNLSMTSAPLSSVSTIVFHSREASEDPFVLQKIRSAEAIFIAGGDQSVYLNYWVNTSVQATLEDKSSTVTMGGTSAGCAILGNHIFSAAVGTVYTDEALEDPYVKYIALAPAFLHLPHMNTVMTDTHFARRDRMGRMLTFMARVVEDEGLQMLHGVGVDASTALLLEPSGDVLAVGTGHAYICTADTHTHRVVEQGMPLSIAGIECERVSGAAGDMYSFVTWSGTGVRYPLAVVRGKVVGNLYGPEI